MKKTLKWTLIDLGIFIGILVIVIANFLISSVVISNVMENFSNTMVEGVKKEIPKALTEPEIRQIVKEEIPEMLTEEEVKEVRELLEEIKKLKQIEESEEEVATEEEEETTGSQGISEELKTGQEFIHEGRKIALTKYEIMGTNINKNLLWVYLYVENIYDVPHMHIHSEEFVIYHDGREDGILLGAPGPEEGRKLYDIGSYNKLYPGEAIEGWTSYYIDSEWKAEDIEIHFKPMIGGTVCIWQLK